MSFNHSDVLLVWDVIIPAGALSPNLMSEPMKIPGRGSNNPIVQQHEHSGFGAGGAVTIDTSIDGINWDPAGGGNLVVTATVPTSDLVTNSLAGRFFRIRATNGGANGGRLVVRIVAYQR